MVVRKRLPLSGPAAVFVTTTVVDWKPIFSDETIAIQIIEQIREVCSEYNVSICAYVLMPSHVHLLLGFPQIAELSQFMKILKQRSARRIKELLSPDDLTAFSSDGVYTLWKPRFDDLIIESEKQFRIKMGYIHNNPVKAGLTEKAADYRHSSARFWLIGESAELPIDCKWRWTRDREN